MKYALLLLLACTFSACTVSYDGNIRYVLQARVTDNDNVSLSGKNFEISSYEDDHVNNYYYNNLDRICFGDSDASGQLLLGFPKRDGNSFYRLTFAGDAEFESFDLDFIYDDQMPDHKIPLDQIVLYRASELVNLSFVLQSNDGALLKSVLLEGKISGHRWLSAPQTTPESDMYVLLNYRVAKNQQVVVRYTSVLNGELTEHTETITIGPDDLQYTLSL